MSGWSPQEDATLHRMWMIEGHSAGYIASTMPGRSRNSVIGRAFRMGWNRNEAASVGQRLAYPSDRGQSQLQRDGVRAPRRKFQGTVPGWKDDSGPVKPTRPSTVTDILSPNAKVWTEREFGECAFPASGEGADTVSCCNHTAETYCPAHRALMTAPYKPGKVYVPDSGPKPRRKADAIFSAWLAA